MNRTACPTRDELAALRDGSLHENGLESIADHVDLCADCQASLETVSLRGDVLTESLSREAPADEFISEFRSRQLGEALSDIGRRSSFEQKVREISCEFDVPLQQVGEYRLIEKIGEGGMGSVYKAAHTATAAIVAVKALPAMRSRDPRAVERFKREMQAVGRLNHPHIVRAIDAGQEGPTPYLVMEYVNGFDLSWLVDALGPLPVADACELIRQAALGLHYAHESGLVHRDIKPSNLMCARDATVKVLDLGLALFHDAPPGDGDELTNTGQIMGTADYIAPEQALDTHRVDRRADIYSLGASLFKLLTGISPYRLRRRPDSQHEPGGPADGGPLSIRARRAEVSGDLEAIVERMLALDPNDRFATAAEVAEALSPHGDSAALQALLDSAVAARGSRNNANRFGSAVSLPPDHAAETSGAVLLRSGSQKSRLSLLIAASAIVLLVGSGVFLFQLGRSTLKSEQESGAPDVSEASPFDRTGAANRRGPTRSSPERVFGQHTDVIRGLAFLPDGRRVVSCSWDGTARLCDITSGEQLKQFKSAGEFLNCLTVSHDGELIAAGGSAFKVYIWRVDTGQTEGVIRFGGDNSAIGSVDFSPDGRRLLVGKAGAVGVFDVATQQPLVETPHIDTPGSKAVFLSGGRSFVAVDAEAKLCEWSVSDGSKLKTIGASSAWLRDIAVLPGATQLVTVGGRAQARLVSGKNGELVRLFRGHREAVASVKLLPDGRRIITGGQDGTARVWRLDDGAELQRLSDDSLSTVFVDVSPDGRHAISGGGWRVGKRLERDGDYRLRLWRIDEEEH